MDSIKKSKALHKCLASARILGDDLKNLISHNIVSAAEAQFALSAVSFLDSLSSNLSAALPGINPDSDIHQEKEPVQKKRGALKL
jgi:hypothetical protein